MSENMHVLKAVHHVDFRSGCCEILLNLYLSIVDTSFHVTFIALPAENKDFIVRDSIFYLWTDVFPILREFAFFLEEFDPR